LLRIAPREGLPKGSIILFGSVSQLTVDSAERNASEWVKHRNWLKERLGDVIDCTGDHSVRIQIGGQDCDLWITGPCHVAGSLQEPEFRLLRNTWKGWQDAYLGKKSRGPEWAGYRLKMAKPVSLYQGAGTMPCTTGSWGDHPTGLTPLTEAGKRHWISKMLCELNREVGLGLATTWSVNGPCRQSGDRQRVLNLAEL
jgi:hypothetical protein